mmetsp:Transcript_31238/g.50590  ORF Transcript_31238/g.50590 Transcript_31238/m.50590 type:complete len:269 (-) Transcript_31238:23-829(-)
MSTSEGNCQWDHGDYVLHLNGRKLACIGGHPEEQTIDDTNQQLQTGNSQGAPCGAARSVQGQLVGDVVIVVAEVPEGQARNQRVVNASDSFPQATRFFSGSFTAGGSQGQRLLLDRSVFLALDLTPNVEDDSKEDGTQCVENCRSGAAALGSSLRNVVQTSFDRTLKILGLQLGALGCNSGRNLSNLASGGPHHTGTNLLSRIVGHHRFDTKSRGHKQLAGQGRVGISCKGCKQNKYCNADSKHGIDDRASLGRSLHRKVLLHHCEKK